MSNSNPSIKIEWGPNKDSIVVNGFEFISIQAYNALLDRLHKIKETYITETPSTPTPFQVRLSALDRALIRLQGQSVTPDTVIEIAKEFEKFLYHA